MLFLFIISNISIFSLFSIFFYQNTAICILFFLLTIIISTLLLFLNGIEFLGFIFLLIYVGAISILFIFALIFLRLDNKLLGIRSNAIENNLIFLILFLKTVFIFILINLNIEMSLILNSIQLNLDSAIIYKWNDLAILAHLLFINPLYIILLSLILLVAMVGSIAMCISI